MQPEALEVEQQLKQRLLDSGFTQFFVQIESISKRDEQLRWVDEAIKVAKHQKHIQGLRLSAKWAANHYKVPSSSFAFSSLYSFGVGRCVESVRNSIKALLDFGQDAEAIRVAVLYAPKLEGHCDRAWCDIIDWYIEKNDIECAQDLLAQLEDKSKGEYVRKFFEKCDIAHPAAYFKWLGDCLRYEKTYNFDAILDLISQSDFKTLAPHINKHIDSQTFYWNLFLNLLANKKRDEAKLLVSVWVDQPAEATAVLKIYEDHMQIAGLTKIPGLEDFMRSSLYSGSTKSGDLQLVVREAINAWMQRCQYEPLLDDFIKIKASLENEGLNSEFESAVISVLKSKMNTTLLIQMLPHFDKCKGSSVLKWLLSDNHCTSELGLDLLQQLDHLLGFCECYNHCVSERCLDLLQQHGRLLDFRERYNHLSSLMSAGVQTLSTQKLASIKKKIAADYMSERYLSNMSGDFFGFINKELRVVCLERATKFSGITNGSIHKKHEKYKELENLITTFHHLNCPDETLMLINKIPKSGYRDSIIMRYSSAIDQSENTKKLKRLAKLMMRKIDYEKLRVLKNKSKKFKRLIESEKYFQAIKVYHEVREEEGYGAFAALDIDMQLRRCIEGVLEKNSFENALTLLSRYYSRDRYAFEFKSAFEDKVLECIKNNFDKLKNKLPDFFEKYHALNNIYMPDLIDFIVNKKNIVTAVKIMAVLDLKLKSAYNPLYNYDEFCDFFNGLSSDEIILAMSATRAATNKSWQQAFCRIAIDSLEKFDAHSFKAIASISDVLDRSHWVALFRLAIKNKQYSSALSIEPRIRTQELSHFEVLVNILAAETYFLLPKIFVECGALFDADGLSELLHDLISENCVAKHIFDALIDAENVNTAFHGYTIFNLWLEKNKDQPQICSEKLLRLYKKYGNTEQHRMTVALTVDSFVGCAEPLYAGKLLFAILIEERAVVVSNENFFGTSYEDKFVEIIQRIAFNGDHKNVDVLYELLMNPVAQTMKKCHVYYLTLMKFFHLNNRHKDAIKLFYSFPKQIQMHFLGEGFLAREANDVISNIIKALITSGEMQLVVYCCQQFFPFKNEVSHISAANKAYLENGIILQLINHKYFDLAEQYISHLNCAVHKKLELKDVLLKKAIGPKHFDTVERLRVQISPSMPRQLPGDFTVSLRALLDRVFVQFCRQTLKITNSKTLYFPVVNPRDKKPTETVKAALERYLNKKKLHAIENSYSKVFRFLLSYQPLTNSTYRWLLDFYKEANIHKHEVRVSKTTVLTRQALLDSVVGLVAGFCKAAYGKQLPATLSTAQITLFQSGTSKQAVSLGKLPLP